ncbi:sigma 54-interacting transcriptional regulator [Synechocystis sp. PCC 7339]|uniref:sigma 54-interacting transcriptional regulator n=1 Tax=Synechocystis sp. PCC 7339 TaxID=2782213 RepID=UPI001CBACCAD|nr:sigma 54-interacting transcriptional regulator [Synechocystis sp. PCC 7339]UAJ73356.1 sigma 54-interacting transcriptional regulator [Synechocystis sp. PCC 7339]
MTDRLSHLLSWLRQRTELGQLAPEILEAIASQLIEFSLTKGESLPKDRDKGTDLYILGQGQLESGARKFCLLPGAIINLEAFMIDTPLEQDLVALTDCQLWYLPGQKMRQLLQDYPQITQAFSQQLVQELRELNAQLFFEQEKQKILRPYLVPAAKRAIMGKSRYAQKLREQIKTVSTDQKPVLLFGEPGLEKDNTAALIHFGSAQAQRSAMVKVNCALLSASGQELFGTNQGKSGILEALGQGTLLLNNIQELHPQLLPAIANLICEGIYQPVATVGEAEPTFRHSQAKVIAIAENIIPKLTPLFANTIKIPPLRVRKADIEDYVDYYLSIICRSKGIKVPTLAPEALRRLQAYDFPNNVRELNNLVERAVTQLQGEKVITEEIIWPSQSKKQLFRLNLLNRYPKFRQFLRSAWWPDRLNYGFTIFAFPLIVAILFLGPQTRDQNFALNLFWAWWWPLVLLGFLFVGRLWCAVCPFMIYGEITQKLSLWLWPRKLKKWPRQTAENWGGWFLFALFALILLWEELWDLENTAYLSAWLLLLITGGAMVCSVIFEQRFWCRYLCPIGGMNGMFAKLAITELRAQQGTCSAECTTYQCYKGGPAKGEGQATEGCPLGTHPAQLTDNRDCVLCMTCLKACPHRSVEFNLRPPAIAIVTTHTVRPYEVALLLLLLNSVLLRRLPEFIQVWNLPPVGTFINHGLLSLGLLFLPALLPLIAYFLIPTPKVGQKIPFINLAYGLLPLTLTANLAHYLNLGLGEAGQVLTLVPKTFHWSLPFDLPMLVADPAAIAFLQGMLLLAGVLWSIFLSQQLSKQSFFSLLPHHGTVVGLMLIFWTVIV